jgi:hypothetical protein
MPRIYKVIHVPAYTYGRFMNIKDKPPPKKKAAPERGSLAARWAIDEELALAHQKKNRKKLRKMKGKKRLLQLV